VAGDVAGWLRLSGGDCGAELLRLDDFTSTTDIRSRLNFASNFKAAIYGGSVPMHKRHCSSMTVRPVWNVMVCCNNTPENLLIIPPINADMADKVAILAVNSIHLPADSTTGEEGRSRIQQQIRVKLPALARQLADPDSPVKEQARDLLRWPNACGIYLSRLLDAGSSFLSGGIYDAHAKRKRHRVGRPPAAHEHSH